MIEIRTTLPLDYTEDDIVSAVRQQIPIAPEEIQATCIRYEQLVTDDRPHLYYRVRIGVCASAEKEEGLLKMRKRVFSVPSYAWRAPMACPLLRPVVVGAGPCGLFAALMLAHAGAKPLLVERGEPVEHRSRRVARFFETGELHPSSNVAFGEGGAGAFSDGKLKFGKKDAYTHAVLETLVRYGAPEDILYKALPHVGTDKLCRVVQGIRQRIIALGGEVKFGATLTDIELRGGRVCAVRYTDRNGMCSEAATDALFLATGHSARDVYTLLDQKGVAMEAKGFGIGVRIEHPREYIDRLTYGENPSDLGAASYHLVTHLPNGRGVYSFCMCPGGQVISSATEEGGLVTNGMSEHRRDGRNSNAALLVTVTPDDFPDRTPLGGIALQRSVERAAFTCGGGAFQAPVQRLGDFLENRETLSFGEVIPTYPQGTSFAPLHAYLPEYVTNSLQKGILDMDAWLPGYAMPDAVLTGAETRTTSPVRVLRDEKTYMSVSAEGLYPCGEGAGYGGGIVSSAVDGLRAVHAYLSRFLGEAVPMRSYEGAL